MTAGRRNSVLVAAVLLCAVVVIVPTQTATAASPLTWSKTESVLPDPEGAFNAMDCATAHLCVGADSGGDIVASSNPTGGTGAWTSIPKEFLHSSPMMSASCPTEDLCLLSDGAGRIYTSTTPSSGGWTATDLASCGDGCGDNLTGVSCATESLCMVVGTHNFVSTNPTGGELAWTELEGLDMQSIDCPSTELCVGVSNAGSVTWSTDPDFGAEAWSSAPLGAGAIGAISCPDQFLCVATSYTGNVFWSTDPTGGASAWHVVSVDPAGIYQVSCASPTLCVAGTNSNSGNVLVSTNPTGPASAWTVQHIDGTNEMLPMSCPTTDLCVTGDTVGSVLFGTTTPVNEPGVATVTELRKLDPDGVPPVLEYWREGTWAPAQLGLELHVNDRLRTNSNTVAAIEFAIGGRAGLHKSTTLVIASERTVHDIQTVGRLKIEKGGIWAKCDKLKDPVEIQTNGGVTAIKG